ARPRRAGRSTVRADAALPDDFPRRVAPAALATPPSDVLLTGATGFLGAFLLAELLRDGRATVHCLVRAPDRSIARARIERHLASYGLWDEAMRDRIAPLPGDLGRPALGLSPNQFGELAERVEVVYHNGARLNFVQPYASLRDVNVGGTAEVLRLAVR